MTVTTSLKLIKLLYFRFCLKKKIIEKPKEENLKMIKNTLPNKSENPSRLKLFS